MLGLYTGARVNELCQINPQTDVFKDPATGIWCICLNEDSEAGEGIVKSMKGGKNRAIPMHRHLIELGFPEYLEAIKKTKAKQLFPAWKPRSGRAAPSAIDWFGTFLDEIGLRGVENENGRSLRGMHAFRHTLLTYGRLAGVNLRCISGHAEKSDNPVADGYEDDTLLTTLSDKLDRLDKLDYGLKFPVPLHIFNIT
jgi:integrase